MKKFWNIGLSLGLVLSMILGMTACKKEEEIHVPEVETPVQEEVVAEPEPEPEPEPLSELEAEITFWTYPIFVQPEGAEAGTYEQQILAAFQRYYPNIRVSLEVLDYETGPARVEEAIAAGAAPDVLFDEPGRIGSYEKKGVLADLGGILTEERKQDLVSQELLTACVSGEKTFLYPFSMVNYVMAFNKTMLETCGAIDLLNREGARTWDTATFEQVLEKLNQSGFKAGSLHCSGVSGDYATRAFLTNLYDAPLMDETLGAYMFTGDRAVSALSKVKEWADASRILNGSGETGADTVAAFVNGETSYTLLWSLPQKLANQAQLSANGIEVVEMPYPSQDGVPVLEYIMNGFCVFDSQDEARLEAAKYLIDFICNSENTGSYVAHTGAVSVRASLKDIYQGNEDALLYEALRAYSGPYYQNVTGHQSMRVYWYQMIAEVLNGEYGAKASVASFHEYASETLKGE